VPQGIFLTLRAASGQQSSARTLLRTETLVAGKRRAAKEE
jgi:hypothetical protein